MDYGQFVSLDREAQFAAASEIASASGVKVGPSTFDGIWRTESSRGEAMRSPAGAKGHFGLMDPTRNTWEKRLGIKVDPDEFGPALFVAAHTMKENLGRFKNVPDALRAYNGGWNPATWGNSETAAYAGKVLGNDLEPVSASNASTAAASVGIGAYVRPAISTAASLWDKPFQSAEKPEKPVKSKVAETAAAFAEVGTGKPQEAVTFGTVATTAAATNAAYTKKEDLAEASTFGDKLKAASFNTLPFALLQALNRDEEPAVPGFALQEEELKGYSLDEQKTLLTASSPQMAARLKYDIQYGKEQDEEMMRGGTALGVVAGIIAAGPEAMITGGIATLALRTLGMGSITLAKAGHKGAAIVSSAAEGALGGVINSAALDMLGKRQGLESYAMGVAGGLLNPMLAGRYLGRTADRAVEAAQAVKLVENAAAAEAKNLEAALKRLPADHTEADLIDMVNTVSAENVRADVQVHKAAVPEERKLNVGQEEEAPVVATPEKAEPQVADRDMGSVEQMGDAIDEPWNKPDFQAKRVEQMLVNDEWRGTVQRVTGMDFETIRAMPDGVHATEGLAKRLAENSTPFEQNTVKAITELASEYLPNAKVIISDIRSLKGEMAKANGEMMSAGNVHIMSLDMDGLKANMTGRNHTALHELGHAIYHQWAPTAPPELMARMTGEWAAFVKKVDMGDVGARADRLAVTHPSRFDETPIKTTKYALSKDEYAAEQFVQHIQNRLLAGDHGKLSKSVIDQVVNGVKAVLGYVMDLVKRGLVKPGKAFDEFFTTSMNQGFLNKKAAEEFLSADLKMPELSAMSRTDIPEAVSKDVQAIITDPVAIAHGLDRLPMGSPAERAEAKQILSLYKKAMSPEYAVDGKRLSTLLSKVDSLNPTSNAMLRSKNPVVRMAAIELVENGGGAAGRRSTAAIAKWMNERAIVGNSIVEMDNNFQMWFKAKGGSNLKEAFNGKERSAFSRLVAEEIEQRRLPQQHTDFGDNVRQAADAMEASFERARLMQVDAKTNGWSGLPPTSRGYLPHRIKSLTYRNLTPAQKRGLHAELTDQFITTSEFDPTFADQLASRYLDRVEQRALGGFDAPMGLHQTGAADVVEDALKAMNLNPEEVRKMMKKHTAGAAAFTKKRLNLDLSKEVQLEDGTSFRLMDVYDTDMLSLMRSQSQRVAGEVALTRHGVYGKPGLALLRRAMGYGGANEQAVLKEMNAFDQVSAEFLGSPVGTANKWVDRAVQYNSIASLGGMGFNQLGEGINIAATLGVKAALQHVGQFGRMRAEIKALAKGGKGNNPLLDSIETMGGAEFGTDAYKMVFPMDNPDLFANSMGADSINAGDRLLRGLGHAQTKLSLWRTIHSTQVRTVAEQIVLKAAKALKQGSNDFHLRDMGFDDDMMARLKVDIDNIATMKDGRITGFDITKATDKEAANAFIQAVHRGGSQIIQGTFIGETGAFVHNSWLRMLTQFRSFSLTAIDKQWNRQVGNRGATKATILTLAAMSAAAPLYMTRTFFASIGRKDQDEYLEKHLSFGAIARATTNYIATAGLAGDFLDAASSVTGMGSVTGGRSGTATTVTGNLLAPAAGKIDKIWGAAQNTKEGTDAFGLFKEAMPLGRLPFLIPAANALSDK